MNNSLQVTICIPTFNREKNIPKAIASALNQSYLDCNILVVDDGSSDNTWRELRSFQKNKNFSAIKLKNNLGTAQAKNIGLIFAPFDAITFHDSDDIAHEQKILLQARAMGNQKIFSDDILDWESFDCPRGKKLDVDVVVGAYNLIKMDGKSHYINKRISLVDDFFPNLQFPSKTPGDWCLINAGLFRKKVFKELGGFLDSIEEDRELRNRTIAAGHVYYFIDEPLLTKIEMSDSLTIKEDTGFSGNIRLLDRQEVWRRNHAYSNGLRGKMVAEKMQTTVHIPELEIEDFINPEILTINEDLPLSSETLQKVYSYRNKIMLNKNASEAIYG